MNEGAIVINKYTGAEGEVISSYQIPDIGTIYIVKYTSLYWREEYTSHDHEHILFGV